MLIKLATAAVMSVCMTQVQASDPPQLVVELSVRNQQAVVGEPLIVEFVLRNETQEAICTPPRKCINAGFAKCVLVASAGGTVVGGSLSGGSCTKPFGVMQFGGHCLETLEPGTELRGRALTVLMEGDPSRPRTSPDPLGAGKYSLTGQVRWGSWRFAIPPTRIEIHRPRLADDVCAARQVDGMYAIFMSRNPVMGMSGLSAAGTVKRIIDECPESVHARMARSRLLVVRVVRFEQQPGQGGATPEIRAERQAQMREMVKDIESHLEEWPDDPLELELFHARIQLLRETNQFSELIKACDELMEKYPNWGFAEEAGRTREKAMTEALLLQAARILEAFDQSDKKPELRKERMAEMLEIVTRIEAQLAQKLGSPDEWDFLKIRVRLLHRFEKMPELIKACDDLIERNPQSKHARKAGKIREEFLGTGAE